MIFSDLRAILLTTSKTTWTKSSHDSSVRFLKLDLKFRNSADVSHRMRNNHSEVIHPVTLELYAASPAKSESQPPRNVTDLPLT